MEVITPTELCVFATVQRFMGPDTYRTSDAMFFVTGCQAREVALLFLERINMYQTRRDVITVVTSGALCENEGEAGGDKDEWDGEQNIFEAEELPLGSRVISALDGDAIFLERHVAYVDMGLFKGLFLCSVLLLTYFISTSALEILDLLSSSSIIINNNNIKQHHHTKY